MSNFTTEVKTVTARKEYDCCCWDIVTDSGYLAGDFPDNLARDFSNMKLKRGKIHVGEEYFMWTGSCDGEMFTARASKAMYNLVVEMDWLDY